MDQQELRRRFATLTSPHLADACLRAQIPVRCAPVLLHAVVPGSRLAGRVSPARHVGSVDIFLEALEGAAPGDVLVVDSGGRLDEACVGDLVALEAHAAGLEGFVTGGCIATPPTFRASGLPVFSLGAIPTGPHASIPVPRCLGLRHGGRLDGGSGGPGPGRMACSSCRPPALRASSRLRRRSATPSDAKPNGSVRVAPCAVRSSSTPTLRSANRRRP